MSDTTDITRRLCDMASHLSRQDADLCDAAADEITRLRAALAQAAPAGWQLVPMTPTPCMLHAGWIGHDESLAARYRAMLAAAPTAQAGAGREPIGYMNEGHLHELKKWRLPYGYVYPSAAVGAETPIYTAHPSPAQREPVAWRVTCDDVTRSVHIPKIAADFLADRLRNENRGRDFDIQVLPLYAHQAPAQREPLSDAQAVLVKELCTGRRPEYEAPVTECEACLTEDACRIRGQCAHYLRERSV